MVSVWKRTAGIGAAVAMFATAGPVALAGASPVTAATPPAIASPLGSVAAFQAGAAAAIGGWNAGADAAVGGFNAGAAALGLGSPFQVNTWGPLHAPGIAWGSLHAPGMAPLIARR
jgi:hypothetical protein